MAPLPMRTEDADQPPPRRKRIIVAMTCASGAPLGIELLRSIRRPNIETHLIMGEWAEHTMSSEADWDLNYVRSCAHHIYNINNMTAPIASGSFRADGMIVLPCSLSTLAAISTGLCYNLLTRAAAACLEEGRRLVLVTSETPLREIHLRNMLDVTRAGAVVFPPVPTFNTVEDSVEELADRSVQKMLQLFDLSTEDAD